MQIIQNHLRILNSRPGSHQLVFLTSTVGDSGVSLVAQMVKNLPTMQETWLQSLGQEDPVEKEMATTAVFLPGQSHGQRNLVGYHHLDTTKHTRMQVILVHALV